MVIVPMRRVELVELFPAASAGPRKFSAALGAVRGWALGAITYAMALSEASRAKGDGTGQRAVRPIVVESVAVRFTHDTGERGYQVWLREDGAGWHADGGAMMLHRGMVPMTPSLVLAYAVSGAVVSGGE